MTLSMTISRYVLASTLGTVSATILSVGAVAAPDAKVEWWSQTQSCSASNRPACDRAVVLASELFERTDRNVAVTWMQVCMAGDTDRCEIGYRRFKSTSFADDPQPISYMFARASCFGGIADLCRPWDDFDTVDESKRALVMAEVCMQGGMPGTCNRALAYFRNEKGLYNLITYDLSNMLCERYKSGSACRVWAEALEANWDHRRAFRYHNFSCKQGLRESCPDAARLKKRVDYEDNQRQVALEAEQRRQFAAQQATSARNQLRNNGYTSNGIVRPPATPFGSSSRDIDNWRRYEKNLCLGNPTSTRC